MLVLQEIIKERMVKSVIHAAEMRSLSGKENAVPAVAYPKPLVHAQVYAGCSNSLRGATARKHIHFRSKQCNI